MRGYVFTIMFSALFILLLMDASIYLASRGSSALSRANQSGADLSGQVMDDLGCDLLHYLAVGVQSQPLNASNQTSITFTDTIPSQLASPGTEFSEWASFAENNFAAAANANISMDTTSFGVSPSLQVSPYNLSYGYAALDKSVLTLSGSGAVTNYSLLMRLNRAINFSNGTAWNWSATNTSLYVSFDIQDGNGTQILVNGRSAGYVDPALDNKFALQGTPSGSLTVEAGNVAGHGTPTLRVIPSGLSARMNTTALLNGTPEITVSVPIMTQVGEQRSSLIVYNG